MGFILLMGLLLIVLVLGVPIAYAISGIAILGNHWFEASSFARLAETQFASLNNFVLMAIPFFILAGNIMMKGQMARSIFDFMNSATRWISGGAAIGSTGACAIFGALTGSSTASAAALSPVVVPELQRLGYPRSFATGLLSAGGTLGIMIPPSVVFILYGVLTGSSVAALFLAAIVPGLILAGLLALTSYVIARKNGYGKIEPFVLKDVFTSFKKSFPALLMPILVLGGIYSGWFTPTEAAAIGVVYAILACRYIYKSLKWSDLIVIFVDSARSSATVLIILAASLGIGLLASFLGIADQLANALVALDLSAWQFLLAVNIILLIFGCFFDGFTLLILFTPLLLPSINALDINPIHFGIIMTANIEIASITPPMGMNLFVISTVTKINIVEIAKGCIPFALALLAGLLLLTYVPSLSLIFL